MVLIFRPVTKYIIRSGTHNIILWRIRLTIFYGGIRNIYSVCFIKLHVTVKHVKILSAAQQYFYKKFMSPATMKLT